MHLVTKARQTVEQYRVLNMFRRESSESAPSGGIHVPARVHCHLLADPQAVRYDHSVNPSVACGRIRHRRLHRQCYQYSPSQKLTCGSMNVQGFCWSNLQHRPKFTAILSMLRRCRLDVLFFVRHPWITRDPREVAGHLRGWVLFHFLRTSGHSVAQGFSIALGGRWQTPRIAF